MKKVRTIVIGAALSLGLLGGAAGAAGGQAVTPNASFPECVTHMAKDGGVGPHVQANHEDQTVGEHLFMMLTAEGDHCEMP